MTVRPFRFGLSSPAPPRPPSAWHDHARRVEDLGFSTLLVPDHLGIASTFAPLVSAADATTDLRVGTLVLNGDFFHPLRLAQEAATVDHLTGGRLELGLGSGWARPEYDLLGVRFDPAPERAARLANALAVMKRGWAGEPTLEQPDGAVPAVPSPMQRPYPPLLIGGHGDTLLRLAAAEADIVGFTGLTGKGGGLAPTGVAMAAIEERVSFVRGIAGPRFEQLELSLLVQKAIATDDRAGTLADLAGRWQVPEKVLAESPFVFLGSTEHIAEKLLSVRERLGISYFAVFEPDLDAITPVVARLSGA
jgi:probable F420-dependent oxidoreductase